MMTAELQAAAVLHFDEPLAVQLATRAVFAVPVRDQSRARLLEFGRRAVPELVSERFRARLARLRPHSIVQYSPDIALLQYTNS